jgi:hypothetical protein
MKSPVLIPAILMIVGILGILFLPHARSIAVLLCAFGMIWLAYAIIVGQRRKA